MGSALQAAWALLGAVFGAGMAYGAMRAKMAKQAADLNGMERRWAG